MTRWAIESSAEKGELCTCSTCGRLYEYDRRKGHTRRRCNSCGSNRATREARDKLKRQMVDYKGGRCELCRYDSCLGALGFHHLTRSEKRFSIAGGHGRSWARIRDELDRCVLLCHNCHAEIHDLAVRRGVATWNRGKAHSLSASGDRPLVTCTGCGRGAICRTSARDTPAASATRVGQMSEVVRPGKR